MYKRFCLLAIALSSVISCQKSKEQIATLQSRNTDVAHAFFSKTKITGTDLDDLKKHFPTKEKDTVAYYKNRFTDIYADTESSSYLRVFYADQGKKDITSVLYFVEDRNLFAQEYYKNGQAMCTFETTITGKRNGYARCYDENGNKKSQTYYRDDTEVTDSLKHYNTATHK